MSALEDLARSRVKTKAAANKLEIALLKKLIESLNVALEAKVKRAKDKAEREKQHNIGRINAMLADSGLSIADLQQPAPRRRRRSTKKRRGGKRGKVAPKYRLVVDGVEHLWSGRGRAPRVFAEYFAQGKSRESVEIAKKS